MDGQHRRGVLGLMAGGAFSAQAALALGAPPDAPPPAPAPSSAPSAPAPAAPDAYASQAVVKTREDPLLRMTAPVRIGASPPLQFLVDTGADRTSISRATAEALQLPPADPVILHGVAGEVRVPTVRIASLEVGDRRLSDVIAPVLEQGDLGAAGLLGIDGLKDQRLLLDFKHTRMVIEGGRKYARDPDAIVVRAKSRYGQLMLVDAWLEGRQVVVIVDSGAESTIANSAFRECVTRLRRQALPADAQVLSVTGQSAWGEWASIPRLKLGGVTVRNLPVVYADLHTFARWGVEKEPAMLLGVDVLRKFQTVAIDFVRREVRFHMPTEVLQDQIFSFNPSSG